MPAGSVVRPHIDQGFYAGACHRYHIPVIIPKCILFEHRQPLATGQDEAQWDEIPFKEGEVLEVNNLLKHRVQQTGCATKRSLSSRDSGSIHRS